MLVFRGCLPIFPNFKPGKTEAYRDYSAQHRHDATPNPHSILQFDVAGDRKMGGFEILNEVWKLKKPVPGKPRKTLFLRQPSCWF